MEYRYSVGNTCTDSNGQRVHIYDNKLEKNVTWCHKNEVFDRVYEMNKNQKEE